MRARGLRRAWLCAIWASSTAEHLRVSIGAGQHFRDPARNASPTPTSDNPGTDHPGRVRGAWRNANSDAARTNRKAIDEEYQWHCPATRHHDLRGSVPWRLNSSTPTIVAGLTTTNRDISRARTVIICRPHAASHARGRTFIRRARPLLRRPRMARQRPHKGRALQRRIVSRHLSRMSGEIPIPPIGACAAAASLQGSVPGGTLATHAPTATATTDFP